MKQSKTDRTKTKKTETVNIRIEPELKGLLDNLSKEANLNHSKYICGLIMEKANEQLYNQQMQDAPAPSHNKLPHNLQNLSHEQQIQNSLLESAFINGLFTNPELSLKSKQIITKEIRNYVGH